jgi:two-component system, OmpR family, response regulator
MKKKIFVIDDDQHILDITQIALESAGYEVETLVSGLGATSKVLASKPDLILIDINMPGLSGPGFVDTLRKFNDTNNSMLIVFHSSQTEEQLQMLTTQHNAAGYIRKGIGLQQFISRINAFLRSNTRTTNGLIDRRV